MAVLDYKIFLILVSIFMIVFLTSRMVSLDSVVAALGMPLSVAIVYSGKENWIYLFVIVTVMALALILRHSANIKRIFAGTENKFKLWKKD